MAATGKEADDPLAPLLTLEDLLTLNLDAQWVVLSACNTAASDGRAEGALSELARGFFHAGTRNRLATHWAVESQSARLLTPIGQLALVMVPREPLGYRYVGEVLVFYRHHQRPPRKIARWVASEDV